MNKIEFFEIDQNTYIEILIPDFEKKVNYYYEPIQSLHMFDEVSVVLKQGKREYLLLSDIINEIIVTFKNSLQYALINKLLLPDVLAIGKIGYQYNIDTHNENHDLVDYSNFWLWSGKTIQTWIYNKNSKIYLEIAPSYPWLYREPEKDDSYITFEDFEKSYKPILVQEISRETTEKWLDKFNNILEKMVKP